MPTVVALNKTCVACPSQWEGALADGQAIYARFRHGNLSVGVGQTVNEAVNNAMSDHAMYEGEVGDYLDGFMEFSELKGHLSELLEFSDDLRVENENPRLADRGAIEFLVQSREDG